MAEPTDRCPSCGLELGERVSLRYKGNLTVIRYRVPDPESDDPEAVLELEHICGQ